VDDAKMAQHGALRPAGGARGVEDRCRVLLADGDWRRHRAGGAGKKRVERFGTTAADGNTVLKGRRLGRRRHAVSELLLVDEHAGTAVGERMGDLRPLLPDPEGHRHGTQARRAEPGEHELNPVA
jgi:hypothetical protein